MLITSHFTLVWVMTKSSAQSKFRGSDYTMVRSINKEYVIAPITGDT